MERVPMTPRKATPVETSDPEGTKRLRADARRNRARILAAAEEVFSEQGASASTEEVASRAGVAIGTVFRHFPTKNDLLRAIMKDLLLRLTDEVNTLNTDGNPTTALFAFFTRMVEQAAAKKTVVALLTSTCQGALDAGWDADLQRRTLTIVFNGLRPPGHGVAGAA